MTPHVFRITATLWGKPQAIGRFSSQRISNPDLSCFICYQSEQSVQQKQFSCLNSLRPRDTYMRQYNTPTLVQIMACRLIGAKPLSETMLPYCQQDSKEHISVKFYLKFKSFHSRKCIIQCRLRNGGHFDAHVASLSWTHVSQMPLLHRWWCIHCLADIHRGIGRWHCCQRSPVGMGCPLEGYHRTGHIDGNLHSPDYNHCRLVAWCRSGPHGNPSDEWLNRKNIEKVTQKDHRFDIE